MSTDNGQWFAISIDSMDSAVSAASKPVGRHTHGTEHTLAYCIVFSICCQPRNHVMPTIYLQFTNKSKHSAGGFLNTFEICQPTIIASHMNDFLCNLHTEQGMPAMQPMYSERFFLFV